MKIKVLARVIVIMVVILTVIVILVGKVCKFNSFLGLYLWLFL